MRYRTLLFALSSILIWSDTLDAQRPLIGFGIGGGVILGTTLLDYQPISISPGDESGFEGGIDLDHVGIFDTHIEIYPIPHLALRGHGMWGSGGLLIQRAASDDGATRERGAGRVRISGLDAGISLWPWTPHSAGFTPFITIGFGRVDYDFNAADEIDGFEARDSRRENAFLFGVGADMNVWRSFTLRIEAMNHRVPSPLEASDFRAGLVPPGDFDQRISNVRLTLAAHLYLPFTRNSGLND